MRNQRLLIRPLALVALALAVLLAVGAAGRTAGHALMWALNAGFLVAALVAWAALGAPALRRWVPVRALLAPLAALGALAVLAHWLGPIDGLAVPAGAVGQKQVLALVLCVFSACFVIASGWFAGPGLRQALRS